MVDMFCLKPLQIINPKYKKLGRVPSEFVSFPDYKIQVPCGLCLSCLKRYQNDWRVRLLSEYMYMSPEQKARSRFLSLSIAPKYYEKALKHPEKLIKHFRDEYRRIFKKSVRFWAITERGDTTDRFHFHMLVFDTLASREDFDKIWKFGFVNNKPIIKERILYCISYITDGVGSDLFIPKERKPKVFCSPGIGAKYASQVENIRRCRPDLGRFDLSAQFGGYSYILPRYLQGKLFSENELRLIKFDRAIHINTPKPPYKIGKLSYSDIGAFVQNLLVQTNVLHPLILDYGRK